MADVKKRSIRKKDWESIGEYIKNEKEERARHQFRADHETIWKEVDRQLAMQPMDIVPKGANKSEYAWRNVLELGEIAKVSEIITADVMRITFPQDRRWFDSHVELQDFNADHQQSVDSKLRSMMAQQHTDFGLLERVKLSIKECLHHGSFVAEAKFDTQLMVKKGENVANVAAPIWVPHSMWNCYPDPSPSILGTSMFYTGSMIIQSYMPKYKLKQMKGEGWMPKQYDEINEDEHEEKGRRTKDLQLKTYYGDLVIPRSDDDIYLPNCKVITANDVVVYYAPIELPYSPIIYGGYEKQDPRDPYFTSPIIKMSPHQKMGSKLASRFLDAIDLKTEPPLIYDGNDPQFILDGGPTIAPGAKSASKGSADYKAIEVGDPMAALKGLEFVVAAMQEGTGVSSIRSGALSSDRATATEVAKTAQGGEVRTVEFIRQLTMNLRSFLYMQHELNKLHMEKYSFYNDDMMSPDFMRVTKKELPDSVHFDVVGAKGLLGEEQRINRTTAVTGFAAGNPLFAPRLAVDPILLEMYRDAGQKNPERFLNQQQGLPPQIQQQMQQMQQAIAQLQQQLNDKTAEHQLKAADIQERAQHHMAQVQMQDKNHERQTAVDFAKVMAESHGAKQDRSITAADVLARHIASQQANAIQAMGIENAQSGPSE